MATVTYHLAGRHRREIRPPFAIWMDVKSRFQLSWGLPEILCLVNRHFAPYPRIRDARISDL